MLNRKQSNDNQQHKLRLNIANYKSRSKISTDIKVKTKNGLVTGVIDTIQIRALDINARYHNYKKMNYKKT